MAVPSQNHLFYLAALRREKKTRHEGRNENCYRVFLFEPDAGYRAERKPVPRIASNGKDRKPGATHQRTGSRQLVVSRLPSDR